MIARILAGALALLVLTPPVYTQTTATSQSTSNARELEREDPRAQRASGFAELLLRTDALEAQKFLQTHAAPGSKAAKDTAKQVAALHAGLAGGFTIGRIIEGSEDDVVVLLNNATGVRGGRMGVRVQIERTAPYRIREVQALPGRRQSGGNV